MPGMRVLACLNCTTCNGEFFGDLPTGHGLNYPALLDTKTGEARDGFGGGWFADWLKQSFRERRSNAVAFDIERLRPVARPLVLNCLDAVYGHALLKLLSAQHYLDQHGELDLIVIVPRWLRWLIPDGVAEIWQVDLPLRDGKVWSDWLAGRFAAELEKYEAVQLAIAKCHPHPDDISIERFSRVRPFDLDTWGSTCREPKVTFVWRDDRTWGESPNDSVAAGIARHLLDGTASHRQAQLVLDLAKRLRDRFPKLDFAVTGVADRGGLADWIPDLRQRQITMDTEVKWCQRFAASHLVIGAHGSNLLLPSAHAGAVIDLMPADRWGNVAQDILPNTSDVRDALVRVQFLPIETEPETVAAAAVALLEQMQLIRINFQRPWSDARAVAADPHAIEDARAEAIADRA